MQVVFHAGVHCTDDDRLLKCLLRNVDALRETGVAVPGPSRYRTMLSESVHALADGEPAPEARETVLDAMLDGTADGVSRLVLSHENFFSVPKLALSGGVLYRRAEERLASLAQLFEGDRITLLLGLRDPATFVPALCRATPLDTVEAVLDGADPRAIRWSHLVERLRRALPDIPIMVWCNEDTPLLWGEVVRRAAGLPLDRKIVGAFDVFSEIVAPEGMLRLRAFLRDNPDVNEAQKRRVMLAILKRYALPEAIEEELDLPGWDAALVDDLSAAYDADVARIARIPGVQVLMP